MNPLKKLAGETVIYGFTTILGRFINWLLVPLYAELFAASEYGIVVNLMGYTALAMVLLTYGTETGFFRFGTTGEVNKVFSTLIASLSVTTLLFFALTLFFVPELSVYLNIPAHPEYITLLVITVGIDVISTIPFALLRMEGKAMRFGILKLLNIFINIGMNLFFLLVCPWLEKRGIRVPFYNPEGGIIYVFLSYLIASGATFIMLLPTFLRFRFTFSFSLLGSIFKYSFPIMVVSLASMVNLQGDKIMMPHILGESMSSEEALAMTGIYGANYKLAVVMYIFTQGFRFAFEPFFFNYAKKEDSKNVYSKVFLYFTGFGLIIFLGVTYWLDVLKVFLRRPEYYTGLIIVPWVLLANLFQGMYYSLSLWYKLTDKTIYGAYMAITGSVITIAGNILFLPKYGYIASAYSVFFCFLVMCVISLYLGHKYYPINYNLKKIVGYFAFAVILYFVGRYISVENPFLTGLLRMPLLLLFIGIFVKMEMGFLLKAGGLRKLFSKK